MIRREDIKYIVREDGKTVVYTIEGEALHTYHTIKDFKEHLPLEQFLYPNKGIIAAASQIVDVSNGFYKMSDGRTFKYRMHNSLLHDNRLLMIGRKLERVQSVADALSPETIHSSFSILDNMPLGVCVIEYIPDEYGFGAEFIIRYCNQQLSQFDWTPKENIIGRSFTEVFSGSSPKWLIACADVALNGTKRYLQGYSPEHKHHVKIYCYQPLPGFCACILTILDHMDDSGPTLPYSTVGIIE